MLILLYIMHSLLFRKLYVSSLPLLRMTSHGLVDVYRTRLNKAVGSLAVNKAHVGNAQNTGLGLMSSKPREKR